MTRPQLAAVISVSAAITSLTVLFTVVARIPTSPETYCLLVITSIVVSLFLTDTGRKITGIVAGIGLSLSIFATLGALSTAFIWSAIALLLYPIDKDVTLNMANLTNNNLMVAGALIGIAIGLLISLTNCLNSTRSN
jgi:hypothetical protein